MAENSKIEWTDATFNPWIGCTKVSPGCDHCYAEAQDKFRAWTPEGWGGPRRRTSEANWKLPLRWNAAAAAAGERRRVFCSSLADVFDNHVPEEWRADLFALIHATPNLDWLLLTKRIGNAWPMIAKGCCGTSERTRDPIAAWPWPNVWLGATIVNQEEADRDIPKLLATPARVRFLSMEPLLGPVDLRPWIGAGWAGPGGAWCQGVHWVIVGGESGPKARPIHPDWASSLRDQCAGAGVPFLFKQWGEWAPRAGTAWDEWVMADGSRHTGAFDTRQHLESVLPMDSCGIERVGKKAAGRLLDGVTHDGFPEVR
jgi:protein gp37